MQIYPKQNSTDSFLSIRFQQILFWGFFYTVFAGVVRKWIFPSGIVSNLLLFGQLILPLILAWQYTQTTFIIKKAYRHISVIYFIILLLLAVNPLNHTIFHGIIGIIIHFGFWYLLLAYLQVSDVVEIKQLDYYIIGLLILETVLASIQYNLPPTHILNRYSVDDSVGISIGNGIRVTGTFSYLGGFAAMTMFYGFFIWSLLNRNQKPVLLVISVILSIYMAFMSGGRGNVVTLLSLIAVGIYENIFKTTQYIKYLLGIGAAIILLSVFFNPLQPIMRAWDNFYDRFDNLTETGESYNRIYRNYLSALLYHGSQPVFGAGLGSDYQGANAVFGASETKQQYGYMEEEGERIVFEGGYFLYFIRIGLFVIVLSAMRIKRLSKVILFLLFFHKLLVFQTYATFFIAMGFIWINQSKLLPTKTQLLCKKQT
ncbi:hypothetical protein FACS189446_1030 [Bacteroidia bacterium]|nr:hypothetical protein FACS189446_1030 [Bacteroidia bacterium]